MLNSLTIDVEEYFHPTEVRRFVDPQEWTGLPSRVEQQTERILELLRGKNTKATFFVLGWVAKRHPKLLRSLVDEGHEIGCHSYAHELVYRLTPDGFRQDTMEAVSAIADAVGKRPRIYRAPSYSITAESLWALEILAECGFTHDSSIYPISHDRYGMPGTPRHMHVIETPAGAITEIPIATAQLPNKNVIPIGGGGYLRMLPYCYTAAGIRRVNAEERQPVCIYLHPWEIDPDQPRLASGRIARARTYFGLKGMFGKLERLVSEFQFSTLTSVYGQAFNSKHAAQR